MARMNCNEFWNQLEQWMEGERPADAHAHLRGCSNCRELVEDLDSIREASRSAELADVDPPERVWLSLRSQLERENLIRSERSGWAATLSNWFGGVLSAVPRPTLAGAYLVALIAVSIALAGPGYRRFNGAEVPTQPLTAQLNAAEQSAVSAMMNADPAVTSSLQKNLAIVDNYIALCEKSVQEDPESEIARDYLYDAYQQKADLLAQITERGDSR